MPRDPEDGASPTAASALCRVLRVGDDAHRFYAAQALGHIGAVDAVPQLIAVLRDPDPDVRSAAAEALGKLGDGAAVEPLLENLVGDPIGDAKVSVVVALGQLADMRAVPLLRELVRGRGENIAWDEEEFLTSGWDDWLDVQVKAIEALGGIDAAEAVPDIVAAIDDTEGQDLAEIGTHALSRLGDAGVGALGRYLDSANPRLRRSAARSLAAAGAGQAYRHLARALDDPSPEIRLIALRAVAEADALDPALTRCLQDENEEVRAAAVRDCGSIDAGTLDALLDDPGDRVQETVIQRLTRPGAPPLRDLQKRLRVKLRGPSEGVAIAAAAQLSDLAPDVALFDLTEQATDTSCPVGLRCAAIEALGTLSAPAVADTIASALADEERRVRLTATMVLGRLAAGQPQARQVLLDVLGRPAAAIGDVAEAPVTPNPEPAAADGNAEETDTAWPTSTLAALTPAAAPAAPEPTESIELTDEDLAYLELAGRPASRKHVPLEPDVAKDIEVRRLTARIAGDIPDPQIVDALAHCLADADVELRRNAADSLTRAGNESGAELAAVAATLIAALKIEKDSQVRCSLVRALGTQRDPAVERVLTRLLSDADSFVRAEALRARAHIGCVDERVESCLADEDPSVRLAAATALARDPTPDRIDKLVAQAFASDGLQRHDIGVLLRDVAPDETSAALVSTLLDDDRRRQWRIAIETLQEVRRQTPR